MMIIVSIIPVKFVGRDHVMDERARTVDAGAAGFGVLVVELSS